MALYFHIVELADGRWACRHGMHEFDQHHTLDQARDHIRALALAERPASIFIHPRTGDGYHAEDV